jgi:hypothetical protein
LAISWKLEAGSWKLEEQAEGWKTVFEVVAEISVGPKRR